MLAEANTSGLAPLRICAASSSEPANEKRAFASSNSPPYCVSAFFSDAAAETVRVSSSLPPQPASASERTASTAEMVRMRLSFA